MTRDVKITYSVSALIFAVLLSCLFIPSEINSRIAAAAVSVPLCILAARLMKKRTVPSINKGQVLGEAVFYVGETELCRVEITACHGVEKMNFGSLLGKIWENMLSFV